MMCINRHFTEQSAKSVRQAWIILVFFGKCLSTKNKMLTNDCSLTLLQSFIAVLLCNGLSYTFVGVKVYMW